MDKFKTTTLPKEAHAGTLLFIIFGGIIVLVVGLSIIGHLAGKDNAAETKGDPGAGDDSTTTDQFRCTNRNYPIRPGTCHPDVMILQRYLKKSGADLGQTGTNQDGVDGQFGGVTQRMANKLLGKEIFNLQDIKQLQTA